MKRIQQLFESDPWIVEACNIKNRFKNDFTTFEAFSSRGIQIWQKVQIRSKTLLYIKKMPCGYLKRQNLMQIFSLDFSKSITIRKVQIFVFLTYVEKIFARVTNKTGIFFPTKHKFPSITVAFCRTFLSHPFRN